MRQGEDRKEKSQEEKKAHTGNMGRKSFYILHIQSWNPN